jgi:hypothetical protein
LAITLSWKTGFEIELMAPRGTSRRDLAERVADRVGGRVHRFFHPQSEPSAVEGRPVFENLTPGFRVSDRKGRWVASFVDDLTLQRDLDRERPPVEGWRRIVADDGRLLRLVERHCDPDEIGDSGLMPLAALFGTEIVRHPSGMVRVSDDRGRSVAIDAPLPGERERPCEIVTAPIEKDHARVLSPLLDDARALGFFVPVEAATHVHFDAAPLCSASAVAALVGLWARHGTGLKRLVGVNPRCVRLGAWPDTLAAVTEGETFAAMDWSEARTSLTAVKGMTKYCDLNLVNLINDRANKHTVEVRVLPGTLEIDEILCAAALFEGLFRWCRDAGRGVSVPAGLVELLIQIPLSEAVRMVWLDRLRRENTAIAVPGRPYSR